MSFIENISNIFESILYILCSCNISIFSYLNCVKLLNFNIFTRLQGDEDTGHESFRK